MLKPEKQPKVNGILRSFNSVFKNRDISKLTKNAYYFIHSASGFIAHYDIHGFRTEYEDVSTLARMILNNQMHNQWFNFRVGDQNYDYYMQRKEIYNGIVEIIHKNFAIKD